MPLRIDRFSTTEYRKFAAACMLSLLFAALPLAGSVRAEISSPPPAFCDGTDLENNTLAGGFISHHSSQGVAQSFTATCSGVIKAIETHAGASSGPVVTGTLRIYEGAGFGGAELLAMPFSYGASGWHRFSLPTPVPVEGGQSYTFDFSPATSGGGSISFSAPYAGGSIIFSPSQDIAFIIDLEPPPITVTTAADNAIAGDGVCTLREAIINSNSNDDFSGGDCAPGSGVDVIDFNIVAFVLTAISPSSPLPVISDPVVIDGTSPIGASCGSGIQNPDRVLQIQLDGSSQGSGSGLLFAGGSSGSAVRGLVIHSFPAHGIEIVNSHGNAITCSFIGTDVTGTLERGNGGNGIAMTGATGNTIGGTLPGDGNLISGNVGHNVHFEPGGDDNIIQGNFIGTNRHGDAVLGPTFVGVGSNQGARNQIGGSVAGAGNLIAGHGVAGIELSGVAATENVIEGNLIGTDLTGTLSLANNRGILVQVGAHTNTIGGTAATARNVISGNSSTGILLSGSGGQNVVQGNYVGTSAAGDAALGNASGVIVETSNNTIGGTAPGARNIISGNGIGIKIEALGAQNVIQGNYIGLNAAGTAALGNVGEGVIVYGDDATIGGSTPTARNVISGNSAGIYVEGTESTLIAGNFIGTIPDGGAAAPNGMGISVRFASATLIGGAGAGNVISGNTGTGIGLRGEGTTLLGNMIGLDATGSAVLSNEDGIIVYDGGGNAIGGTAVGEGNVISGNRTGVVIEGIGQGNIIEGNIIGTNAAGAVGLGNSADGISITGDNDNTVVRLNVISGNDDGGVSVFDVTGTLIQDNNIGLAPDNVSPLGNAADGIFVGRSSDVTIENNVIAYQGGYGVAVDDDGVQPYTSGVSLVANRIFDNGFLGIDLDRDGVSANDPGDGDAGPNGLMNHPILSRVTFFSGSVTVDGVVDAAPSTNVHVEFFANYACDFSGYGEGEFYLGSLDLTTGATGSASFSPTISMANPGLRLISAVATDTDGNSSEFSRCATPDVGVPTGHVYDVLADALAQPQGLVVEGSGNFIVGLSGTGEITRLSPDGSPVGPNPLVYGMTQPIGMVLSGPSLYVADGLAGKLYKIDLSTGTPVNALSLTPLVDGLNAPAHIALGSDGFLYVTLMGGDTGEKVIRVDPNSGASSDHVTFSDSENVNPEGIVFAPNGDLFVALQARGEVVRIPAGSAIPVDGSSLTPRLTDLDSPNGLSFGPDGRLYVATRYGVKAAHLDASISTDFVTGLSGNSFNSLIFDGVLLGIADGSSGRVLRVTAPTTQTVDVMPMTYTLHTASLDGIGAGGAAAARAAFAAWQDVVDSDASFIDGGSTTDPTAGIDGINKVTVDKTFPFPPLVLAIAAKTIVFGSTPGSGTITDADIVISPEFVNHTEYPIGTEAEPGAFDLQSIITHEVGHVLGLVHSGIDDATMYFVLQSGKEARTLTRDDRAWVGYRYRGGSAVDTNSVSGHLTDGVMPGAHVSGALVVATNTATSEAVHAYSDENGDYYIPGLPTGSYLISIAPLSGSLKPGNISAYLQTIANNLTFEPEFWNDTDESASPTIDVPSASVAVSVSGAVSGIDFITNQDVAPPTIAKVFPAPGAVKVALNTEVLVTFSEPIVPNTLQLKVETGGSDVPGSVVVVNGGRLGIFTPNPQLIPGTTYEIRVTDALSDLNGNFLADEYVGSFTTVPPDVTSPLVEAVNPIDGAGNVPTVASVNVVFSEPMDPASLTNALSLSGGSGVVLGSVALELDNTVVVFTPANRLDESTPYTISVAPTAKDASLNSLNVLIESTFTTGVETVAIAAVGPTGGAGDISVTTAVLADFTAPIDLTELSTNTFQLLAGGTAQVPGTFEVLNDDTRVVFRPEEPLAHSASYTIAIPDPGLPDDGQGGHSSTFTTSPAPLVPMIFSAAPASAAPGKTVVVNGTAFDPNPANVQVSFNGVLAIVTEATLTSVTTTVPAGATSGPLVVSIGVPGAGEEPFSGVATNAIHFDVAEPVAVTEEVVARVTSDAGTRDGAISPDGAFAFVTNSGANSVTVIDLDITEVEESIGVGDTPLKIAITPNGRFAYVTNFVDNTVSVIDTGTRTVVETINVGLNPIGVAITPDGTRAYVGEYTGKAISVIDIDPGSGAANQVVARVTSDSGVREVAISPDGTLMLATGTHGVTIVNIDPGSNTYNQVVARVSGDTGTRSAEISPDGTYGFVSTMAGEILVIDLNTSRTSPFQVVARVTSDSGTREVALSPDGTTVFATNFEDNTVTAYSFSAAIGGATSGVLAAADPVTGLTYSLTPVDVFTVGTDPQGIVFAPSVGIALVANSGSNDVSIIRFSAQEAPPPAERIAALVDQVEAMVAAAELNPGHGTALVTHLQLAAARLAKEDLRGTVKQMELFVKKVEGQVAKNQLDPATGAAMVEEAQAVIADLSSGAAKQGIAATQEDDTLPTEYALAQNYPNPFNTSTLIEYDIPTERTSDRVALRVYDLLGRTVMTLVDEDAAPGRYSVMWDGRRDGGSFVASGVYLVQMQAGAYRQVRKIVVVR